MGVTKKSQLPNKVHQLIWLKKEATELRITVMFAMKMDFAFLVLLALFTKGKGLRWATHSGLSGMRQANHKNHALNMTELVKTAVLHEDDALRHSTGTVMPELPESFQFPVVVDLTEFEDKLEQRFASINENIASINGNMERLRTSLASLTECAMGTSTYQNPHYDSHVIGFDKKDTISFGQTFKWIPNVIVSLGGFNTVDPEGGVTATSLQVWVYSSTTTQFVLGISGDFMRFYRVDITWVACAVSRY